ncbi:MAG TPA: hypothetical protein VH274_02170 [Mycobacteriales bacterium]|nr:hypothetical protein [Mycobacteriales bacterium]
MLYPPSFRREYGGDLVQAFNDLVRADGRRRAWARCLVDLSRSAPRLQMEEVMQRIPTPVLVVSTGALAAGGYFAVAIGAPAAAVVLLVATIVLLTTRGRIGRGRAALSPEHARSHAAFAVGSAAVFLATVGSWLYHIQHYDSLGSTTVLIHNVLGIVSLVTMVAFSAKALQVRRHRTADLP